MFDWLLLGLVFALSWALTGGLRRYALNRNILDIPNERSSHTVPTPRGGGVSIIVTFLAGLVFLFITGHVSFNILMALFGGGLLVSVIGFIDDCGHVPAPARLLVHFIAASWSLAWLGGIPPLQAGNYLIEIAWLNQLLGLIFIVWLLNLFNFMDGIDGIAGTEAIFIAGGSALMLTVNGVASIPLWLGLIVAGSLGFLVWNWPQARIFMGDAGSGFLGFTLALFAVLTGLSGDLPIWTWLILFGVFLVDATVTLIRRMLRGGRWFEAHRSHAYQHASRKWNSHSAVLLAVIIINVLWLLPLAWCALIWEKSGLILTLIAYSPLFSLAIWLGAGLEKEESLV